MFIMDIVFLTAFLRPFVLLATFVLIVIPIRVLVMRIIPDGKIKRILNKRIN
jgi:hypothetical protein